ncbi:hypothetical protein PoB_003166500 [Plakobranchus ocellatus]|uniref:Uncharacterized protein n=1 Tax=Plakobranchus ocellatus TaxID=259542 RepID=A0AAV4AEH9_9GAST|nr:hypothetical protein PoB_003166500 [Plakobranchus ocellatus]
MQNIKPLEEENNRLESELRDKAGQLVHLSERLHAEEALRNQRTSIIQRITEVESEKVDLEKTIKSLEAK